MNNFSILAEQPLEEGSKEANPSLLQLGEGDKMAEVIEIVNSCHDIMQGDKAETEALKRMKEFRSLSENITLLMMIGEYDKGNKISTLLKEAIESDDRDVVDQKPVYQLHYSSTPFNQIIFMDPVLSTLGSILVECGKVLCGSVSFNIQNFFKFNSNVETLDKDIKSLLDVKKLIEEEIRLAEIDGGTRTIQVTLWLRKVEEIELVVNSILTEVRSNTQNFHGGCINMNCSLRCTMSRKVVKQIKEVQQLMDESSTHQVVMVDPRLKPIEQLPGPCISDQKTASENLAKILNLLKDDRVGTIGMLGMGGIGKTTLIRNLNNELECMDLENPFSIVVWVTVSKDLNLERVQDRMAERLNMKKIKGESMDGRAVRLFNRLRKEKRFIVILDDVWERIDLDKIGIPQPKIHVGCKIILTTRSLDLCREMETDVQFTVAVLSNEESWSLFAKSVGDSIDSEDIRPVAEAVVKECGGLPLAIITVGRAMRGKKRIELWKHALRALRTSSPVQYIKGVEKELFLPLKLSYDSLEGNYIKPCFLYCCLYPEDFSIEVNELVCCWRAEGLLDEQEDHEEAYNMGISLIESLKDSCLLECGNREGTVRMHDIVRDVAIWIASSSEDGNKSLIRSGFGLSTIPAVETWAAYKRVSFMHNRLQMLPRYVSQGGQVSTLLLQVNAQLEIVPSGFLEDFHSLRVLNLSETQVKLIPSMENLGELRALFLRNCSDLREYPSFRLFSRLQVLDLSGTCIKLSPDDARLMLKELGTHNHLIELYVDLYHVPSINLEDSAWMKLMRRFRISIGIASAAAQTFFNKYDAHTIYLSGPNYSVLSIYATFLIMNMCQPIVEIWSRMSSLEYLKSLAVHSCSWTGSMGIHDSWCEPVLLPRLETLSLFRITNLPDISNLLMQFGANIKTIEIENCHDLKHLFSSDFLHKVESLEEIHVKSCNNLEEIITNPMVSSNALPNLHTLELIELPRLKCVWQQEMVTSCLKRIEVSGCSALKKLPLPFQHVDAVEVIN